MPPLVGVTPISLHNRIVHGDWSVDVRIVHRVAMRVMSQAPAAGRVWFRGRFRGPKPHSMRGVPNGPSSLRISAGMWPNRWVGRWKHQVGRERLRFEGR